MALSQINLKKRLHIIMCISVIIHKFLTYYNAIIKQVNFVNEKFMFDFKNKQYFEERMGNSIYSVLPDVIDNTFDL